MAGVQVLVRRWRGRLALTYGLVVVENSLELLYPFALGVAVDGLLDERWAGVALFAGISLTHIAVGFGRQRFDARSFARLNATIASDLVRRQRDDEVPTTSIVARTHLADDYVSFLESGIPLAITALFAVGGSLLMLFLYDPVLGLAATALLVPVALLNRRLMRRSAAVFRTLNDEAELEVDVIRHGSHDEINRHFRILNRQWVHLSDAEATSWSLVEVLAVVLLVFALVRTTDAEADVGIVFATIAYVWTYVGGFDQIPSVLQRLASLGDIRRRLDALESDPDGETDAADT